ncbi:MAG: heat-inducible transcriptional repressor HrcA [Guyparkeria sp.]|uniref:heat-inducible transcriptional repressor HrcA n=1 Tax=Guyparkeria sp. TaxID=2035736 RepID=UPI00397A4F3D
MTDAWSELPERAQTLLRVLIDRYTDEGAPVGSRALARMSDLNLSPATVRNVMADLEDLGLVRAPHTSSGRVPTELAYRLFVDSLLISPGRAPVDARRLERILREAAEDDPQHLADTASNLLSSLTQFAGVVTIPSRARALFRQIDFVSLSPGRVLMVLVTNDGGVQNRIIHPDKPYSQDELTRFANFLNERLNGQSIQALRETLVAELKSTREQIEGNLSEAITLAESAVEAVEDEAGVAVAGQVNLMGIDELGDVDRMRRLFNAFAEKRELVSLLDRCERAQGVKIFIGRESGSPTFDECGVVGASYGIDDEVVGVLGVIGPKRMPYDRVISIVDVTSRLLSSALSRQ